MHLTQLYINTIILDNRASLISSCFLNWKTDYLWWRLPWKSALGFYFPLFLCFRFKPETYCGHEAAFDLYESKPSRRQTCCQGNALSLHGGGLVKPSRSASHRMRYDPVCAVPQVLQPGTPACAAPPLVFSLLLLHVLRLLFLLTEQLRW